VEVALTRMARPHADLTIESLAERVAALESGAPIRDTLMQDASVSERPALAAKKAPAAAAPKPAPEVEPAPPAAAPIAPPPRASGESVKLDVASVKRAWPAVVAEFKKRKPSRGHAFDGTEAETDGELLIVEFPAGQALAMELVGDGESLALLRRCVGTVLGVEPPLEYRLGRSGRSKPAKAPAPKEAEPAKPVEPADAPQTAPAPAKAAEAAPPAAHASGENMSDADLEAQVIAELGAQVLGESDAQ
jgi:DNA polymerase-3 subunit gamma/tau